MTPKVDTFEHNIVEEIKRKDASLTQISAASNDVGNIPTDTVKKNPIIIMIAGSIFIVCLIGGAALAYYYYTDSLLPPSAAPVKVSPTDVPKKTALLATISPTLDVEIGRVVTKVEKKNEGYILTINDYSAVFGYMTRNESEYIEELASLFSPSGSAQARATSISIIASSTPKVGLPPITASTSPIVISSSTASSSH